MGADDPDLLPVTTFEPAAMRKAIASISDVREDGTREHSPVRGSRLPFPARRANCPGPKRTATWRMGLRKTGRTARIEGSGEGDGA